MVVQKSNPLLCLAQTDFTLEELKIIECYLGRINSHDLEKRTVEFKKGEIEKLLNVKRIRAPELQERLKHLQAPIQFVNHTNNEILSLVLFETARATLESDGHWTIQLSANIDAVKYFFEIEQLGYVAYKLCDILNISSKYAYALFMHIVKRRQYKNSWSISVSELKNIMNCKIEYYEKFYRFNEKVLQRAMQDINLHTRYRITVSPIKKNGKVSEIKIFTREVEKKKSKEIQASEENQVVLEENDKYWFIAQPTNHAFSSIQNEAIFNQIAPIKFAGAGNESIDQQRFHFIGQTFTEFLVAKEEKNKSEDPIRDEFKYFFSILKNKIEKITQN